MAGARIEWLLGCVRDELVRATEKHAPMHSGHEGYAVILEELDELWEHVKADTGSGTAAMTEAVQIAAMALRYVHDLAAWGPLLVRDGAMVYSGTLDSYAAILEWAKDKGDTTALANEWRFMTPIIVFPGAQGRYWSAAPGDEIVFTEGGCIVRRKAGS